MHNKYVWLTFSTIKCNPLSHEHFDDLKTKGKDIYIFFYSLHRLPAITFHNPVDVTIKRFTNSVNTVKTHFFSTLLYRQWYFLYTKINTKIP